MDFWNSWHGIIVRYNRGNNDANTSVKYKGEKNEISY